MDMTDKANYCKKQIKEKEIKRTPDLHILSKALFWDTGIQQIDWERQYTVQTFLL